jgi:uncharacterized protein YdhG (YjbR/CyaY superfamily)
MTVIDEYLQSVAPSEKAELERIRKIVHDTAPAAEEVITYSMPGFKYMGKYLISFAAFKDHLSIFPGSDPVGALKDTLKDNITGKGTIQFTLDAPLSDEVIQEIVELCVGRVEAK